MATERVARTDAEWLEEMARQEREEKTWRPKSEDDPSERFDTKLHQAEMLAKCISGSDDFEASHPVIKGAVIWLLADLLTEVREARDEAEEKKRTAGVRGVQ